MKTRYTLTALISFGLLFLVTACAEFDVAQRSPTLKATPDAPPTLSHTPKAEADACKDPLYKFPVKPNEVYRFETAEVKSRTFDITLPYQIQKLLLPLDVLFLLDTTQSMQPELDLMKSQALDLIREIRAQSKDAAFGMATFDDIPVAPYGIPGVDEPFRLVAAIGETDQSIMEKIQTIRLHDGGDLPEGWIEALYRTATDANIGWRKNSQRLVLVITDAPSHNFDTLRGNSGISKEMAIEELLRHNIQVVGLASMGKIPSLDELKDPSSQTPISADLLNEVAIRNESHKSAVTQLTTLAGETRSYATLDLPEHAIAKGGPMVFTLNKANTPDLARAIVAAIKSVVDVHRSDITIEQIKPKQANKKSQAALPLNRVQILVDSLVDGGDRKTRLIPQNPAEPTHILTTSQKAVLRLQINRALESCHTQQFAFRIRVTDQKKDAVIYHPELDNYSLQSDFDDTAPTLPPGVLLEKIIGIEIVKTNPKPAQAPKTVPTTQPALSISEDKQS